MTLPARPVTHSHRIALGGLKGGLGKSTSAWMLAWALHRRGGGDVLLVDADPSSQTVADSHRVVVSSGDVVPFDVLSWPTAEGLVAGVRAHMRRLGTRHLIVDTGGETEEILQQACLLCTDLIVPVAPNVPDLRRIPATLATAASVSSLNDVRVHVLLTACDSTAGDAPAARAWMRHEDRQWPVLRAQVPDTVLYKRGLFSVPDRAGVYDDVLDELDARQGETANATTDTETGVI